MCGIFGMSWRQDAINVESRAILAANLAIQNDQRGGDSFGIVGFKNNRYSILKGIGDLSDSAYELTGYDTLFAHTRYATNGTVSVKNAHPFKIGKIIGAHNGMIRNHHDLNKMYGRDYEVDSMHIFAHLNDDLPMNELEGYGAIEWIDKNDPSTIYLTRFRNGELAIYGIGEYEDPIGIVWSSSYRHLIKSLAAAGINNYFRYEIRTGKTYAVKDQVLISADRNLNLSAPAPEKFIPAQDTQQSRGTVVGPYSHLVPNNRIPKNPHNPMTGHSRHDHYNLFRQLYAADA